MSWKGKPKQLALPGNKALLHIVQVPPDPFFSLKGSFSERRVIKPALQHNQGISTSSMETFRQNEGQFLVQRKQMSLEKHKTGQKSRAECKVACSRSTTPPLFNRTIISNCNQLVNTKERSSTAWAQEVHLFSVLLPFKETDTGWVHLAVQPQMPVAIQS